MEITVLANKRSKSELSNKEIAIYALYVLGGWQKRIHTEDVALKCFELAPSKFSWVRYPQYPDLAPARFALEQAEKPNPKALVKGESERTKNIKKIGGWMLTSEGINWLMDNKTRIEEYLGKHVPMGERLFSDRKVRELLESPAYRKFSDFGDQAEISHAEFAESLVCTVNTKAEILNDRLDQLSSIAENLRRKEIKNYVNHCRKKFDSILGGKMEVENDNI